MTPKNYEQDIYINIAVTREMLETLLKRGKPASVADLQTLMASVEAKSRSTYILPAEKVADALAPKLLPLLPTPDNLVQAGQQSAVRMEAAIKAGTVDSVKLIQLTVQKFVTALEAAATKISESAEESAAKYEKATAAAPRSLPVSFTDDWRWGAGLVLGPLALVLLVMELCGQFSKVSESDFKKLQETQKQSKTNYEDARAINKTVIKEGTYYKDQIKKYRAKNPKTKDFPAYKVPE